MILEPTLRERLAIDQQNAERARLGQRVVKLLAALVDGSDTRGDGWFDSRRWPHKIIEVGCTDRADESVIWVDAEVLDDSTAIQRCCEEDDLKEELVPMVSDVWQTKVGC